MSDEEYQEALLAPTFTEINDELIEHLCSKKLPAAQRDFRVSTEICDIVAKVQQHLTKDELKIFNLAVSNPQRRRRDKSAQQVLFWGDKELVRRWLTRARTPAPSGPEHLE